MCNLFKAYANRTRSVQTADMYVRSLIRAFAFPSNKGEVLKVIIQSFKQKSCTNHPKNIN